MGFWKKIYENAKKKIKKNWFHNKHIFIYGSQTFWSFMNFYFTHIVKACFAFKKAIVLLFFCICIKHSQH